MRTPDGPRRRGESPARVLALAAVLLASCAGEATDGRTEVVAHALQPDQELGLSASFDRGGSEFGRSVAIAGELLAIGDPEKDSVHIYRADADDFRRVASLEGAIADAGFGRLVQVSGDAVVVAYDADVQRVEAWGPGDDGWSMRALWEPDISAPGAEFGSSLYADEARVIIGAPQGANSGTSAGGRVFVLEGEPGEHQNWDRHVLADPDRYFGRSVGFDGRWLAVGVENWPGAHEEPPVGAPRGGVKIFEHLATGTWSSGELVAIPGVVDRDHFGESVVVHGGTVFIGYPHATSPSAVYAFERIEGRWQRTQTFDAPVDAPHHFGSAIAASGELLAIGSRHNNQPVRTYRLDDGLWVEAGIIAEPIEFEKTHLFGWSLASDDERLLVGSPGPALVTSPPSLGQGRAHLYRPGIPPDAPEQRFVVYEDTPLDFSLHAADPDGGELSYRFSALAVGRITQTDRGWRYAPGKNWHGTDSFNYTVTDSLGLSTTSRLTFEIRAVNDRPVVKDEYLDCIELPCRVETRLHTVDIDGDPIADYEVVEPPSHGRVELRRGMLYYELDEHPDLPRVSFEIRVSDGMFWSEPAVVDIIIEAAGKDLAKPNHRAIDDREEDRSANRPLGGCSSVKGEPPAIPAVLFVLLGLLRVRPRGARRRAPSANL